MSHHLTITLSSEWELTTAFTKGWGLATATEISLQKRLNALFQSSLQLTKNVKRRQTLLELNY